MDTRRRATATRPRRRFRTSSSGPPHWPSTPRGAGRQLKRAAGKGAARQRLRGAAGVQRGAAQERNAARARTNQPTRPPRLEVGPVHARLLLLHRRPKGQQRRRHHLPRLLEQVDELPRPRLVVDREEGVRHPRPPRPPLSRRPAPAGQGRYSFVGARPSIEVVAKGNSVTVLDHEKGKRLVRFYVYAYTDLFLSSFSPLPTPPTHPYPPHPHGPSSPARPPWRRTPSRSLPASRPTGSPGRPRASPTLPSWGAGWASRATTRSATPTVRLFFCVCVLFFPSPMAWGRGRGGWRCCGGRMA